VRGLRHSFKASSFCGSDQSPKARDQVAAGLIGVEAAKNKVLIKISGGLIQDWQAPYSPDVMTSKGLACGRSLAGCDANVKVHAVSQRHA
jgi:hypothetical protein